MHLAPACLSVLSLALPASAAPQELELGKLLASDSVAGDQFGISVAIDGTTLIAGAYLAAPNGGASGAAYLFDVTTGMQVAQLLPEDGMTNDLFGWSVATSGNTALVGAVGSGVGVIDTGAAYLFDTSTGMQLAKLVSPDGKPNDRFGRCVALSGAHAVVGAWREDEQGTWAGAAYLFDARTGTFLTKLLASDGAPFAQFGRAVGIDGTTVVVTAPGTSSAAGQVGTLYVFDALTGNETHRLLPPPNGPFPGFGVSVAIDGPLVLVGAESDGPIGTGLAYVFDLQAGELSAVLVPPQGESGDEFGASVDLSGTTALVGAPQDDTTLGQSSGSAHVYDLATGKHFAELRASDGQGFESFGSSVALRDSLAFTGVPGDGDLGSASGSIYRYAAPHVTYCTAGLTASGCQASLSAQGQASSSAPSGFTLHANNVEGAKDGLYFFGTSGRQATPWGNGTSFQCVVPPLKRAGLLPSLGTPGLCDGRFTQDLNSLWCPTCPKPTHNPGPGAAVQTQLWFRDPRSTSNQSTSLSNALEFTVVP